MCVSYTTFLPLHTYLELTFSPKTSKMARIDGTKPRKPSRDTCFVYTSKYEEGHFFRALFGARASCHSTTTHLWHDVAQGVHDALLEVVEHETALPDASHHAGEVVVQEDDRSRLNHAFKTNHGKKMIVKTKRRCVKLPYVHMYSSLTGEYHTSVFRPITQGNRSTHMKISQDSQVAACIFRRRTGTRYSPVNIPYADPLLYVSAANKQQLQPTRRAPGREKAKTTGPTSFETSEPVSAMAMPMSERLRAGESFTPSPVTLTMCPRAFVVCWTLWLVDRRASDARRHGGGAKRGWVWGSEGRTAVQWS